MATRKMSQSLIAAEAKSVFNANGWDPVDEPWPLKELWAVTRPGVYEKIVGDKAPVTLTTFEDGSIGKRISITIKGQSKPIELKVSSKSDLEEGDYVRISTITGQELSKIGSDNILRYDGELFEE